MKQITITFKLLLFLMVIVSCRNKEKEPQVEQTIQPTIEINITPYFGGLELANENVVFTTEEGYEVKLRDLKIILTEIKNEDKLLSDAAMYSFKKGKKLLKVNGTSAGWGALNFNVGVSQTINHSDPSAFPNDHVLNILNASDMHWSWNPGYIFVKIEMIADTLQDGIENFNHPISFHIGMDETLQEKSISNLNWESIGNQNEQLKLKVNFHELLHRTGSSVDLKNEHTTHSSPDQISLSKKLAENFKEALTPF